MPARFTHRRREGWSLFVMVTTSASQMQTPGTPQLLFDDSSFSSTASRRLILNRGRRFQDDLASRHCGVVINTKQNSPNYWTRINLTATFARRPKSFVS
jgi:hypothetical protein